LIRLTKRLVPNGVLVDRLHSATNNRAIIPVNGDRVGASSAT
jgi:hypothetical protein